MIYIRLCLVIAIFGLSVIVAPQNIAPYRIGVGRADCTGPPVEIAFMGYANLKQKGQGLHLRQYSRAFVVEKDNQRVAFVSVDVGMVGHALKREAVKKLQARYGEIYTLDNIMVTATHTHGAPGGFLMHLLYDISILGFVPQTFDALAQGIYLSVKRAHENMHEGRIFLSKTTVLNANINRSPTSYLVNPPEEREMYEHDVDKTLTQLRFINTDDQLIGVFNWFAVHPVSMNNTNHLVTSDNMGYASMLLEKEYNPTKLSGKGKFVGAFANSNLGDVSPNILGPKCAKTGNACDVHTSACPKGEGECFSSGPGIDMFESTKMIATRIYEKASTLLKENEGREITGEISYIHQFVDMPSYNFTTINPNTNKTQLIKGCIPAMGYSFAAGTTDGPGSFAFQQGTITDNPLWNAVRDFIVSPTQEDISCHSPKPILLATGRATFPYEWQPKIVATQLLKIGDLIITGVPGEFTTMSGRRLKRKINETAFEILMNSSRQNTQDNPNNLEIIIAGLANVYSSYITTYEEYQQQRYEAASTIFGPHTLSIYIHQYQKLLKAMLDKTKVEQGPIPPYLNDRMLSLNTGVVFDGHPIGEDFGSVKVQPKKEYKLGETVKVSFIAGNPRNNIFHEKTYFTVERQINEERWKVTFTDANWETRMYWERKSTILGFSDIHITWTIGPDTTPGVYRIRHFGNYKYILGGVFPYEGTSRAFKVNSE
ncbi:neutral ceramidase-like [Condylostylus longicornis]|uniref:neutral ceramidase-like n=1 Tax=Condylostylus longicornis TaxID=2530218 RepID=UPI00244E1EEA|nr:neutral ceramidase-like [Condylostylus longicornis]XP_055380875.1 neutral ceramidase-like [Condylostylus longicornis]XP_055380876.1 neutral ceramidase-like [Condylostylus longicornis]XP_055380877.1 neutral ceramidase-like [Condylostylus longicornis]XP_055380878.1 neutral ceramidase-like [Condylostylus longicornis]XP_055380880.1 neutral ceramidase-like [Condylostylus longicornis]XP_055380881.1 neutral ceramidase-like [Condylostylus longicornis]